ncbi:thiopeptide-type bacteriocin biosynthesis protein [Streptomyces sp. NPDC058961]|uniref:thiopeptide-type bacteriocin biosynthesis protein n=1 Tax=Streptomyces sp. NPDC058961 TaxID=3346680 RepID=UPI0036AA631B
MQPRTDPQQTESGVLAVLAGSPLDATAHQLGADPADLADAVTLYRAAGLQALRVQGASGDWQQVRIQFTDWQAAEAIAATRLRPALEDATLSGLLTRWWFIRKAPHWRLRLLPGADPGQLRKTIAELLDRLTAEHLLNHWRPAVYEPETLAFGGPAGIDTAHDLFHADSRHLLGHLTGPSPIGRRELSVLLLASLFRGAGQEWHEQGDIWHRVTRMRPLPDDVGPGQLQAMTGGMRRLMTVDTGPAGSLLGPGTELAFASPWAAAFTRAGQQLATAAHLNTLERGLRGVLAHHVIFHWNRIGLPARTQALLTRAARDTIMASGPATEESTR